MTNYVYLNVLFNHAAVEIGHYIREGKGDFTYVNEFTDLIKEHIPKDDEFTSLTKTKFPYWALCVGIEYGSNKKLKEVAELSLQMRLLSSELSTIEELSKERLENLRDFICNFNNQILPKTSMYRHRLVG